MAKTRKLERVIQSRRTMEGAGVLLQRVFGFDEDGAFDPFLLLDFFGSDKQEDYVKGFPWHPHRGMETVTYMVEGSVEHADSIGNSGVIESGDIQWMTAGSGIIHQEMPRPYHATVRGLQLWVNLPSTHKMMKPRYQDIPADTVPLVDLGNVEVKVLAGNFCGTEGPVKDIVANPLYLDITVAEKSSFITVVDPEHTVFAFVFEGKGYFDDPQTTLVNSGQLAHLVDGDTVKITAGDNPVRFLLVTGKPLREPVAWHGPIVMNTQEEVTTAFREFREGTFVK
jgi:quercetin 2,3-dioxygenase